MITIKIRRDYSISAIAIIPFLVMGFSNILNSKWLDTMDQAIGTAAVRSRNDVLTPIARFFTALGGTTFSIVFLAIVCLTFFFVVKRKDLAIWYGVTAAFGAAGLNQLVKFAFKKPRPVFEHLVLQGGYTFPSGHSMGSVIIYGGFLFLILHLYKDLRMKKFWAACTVLLILFIGISRVYLGVHFASDVIGGYSLGASTLFAFIGLYHSRNKLLKKKKRKEKEGAETEF